MCANLRRKTLGRQFVPVLIVVPVVFASNSGQLRAAPPLERIADDKDANFPKGVTRIAFDTDATGKPLKNGTDVSTLFSDQGCTFETSVAESYVGVHPYDVGGRSGGKSIATWKPLYQGVITIRFCKPGHAKIPATVTTVGFWTAHVSPGGTALQAYDKDDKLIGSVSTTKHQRDFLAVKSKRPIAYIKVVPDIEIDPDYAIDDLVFDAPTPLMK